MTSGWPEAAGLALLLAFQPQPGAAQGVEGTAAGFLTTARVTTLGFLAGARWRPGGPGSSIPRLAASLGGGAAEGEWVGRLELSAQVRLPHPRGGGAGWYLAGGIAGVSGPDAAGWILALVGIETNPDGESGLTIEAGIGGGFRAAVGWRWRRRRRTPKRQPPRTGRGGEPSRSRTSSRRLLGAGRPAGSIAPPGA